jgi:hypothetical protein
MKRIVIFIVVSVLCTYSIANAQQKMVAGVPKTDVSAAGLQSPGECKKLCENFVQLMVKGETNKAFEAIKPFWPLPESEIATLQMQTTSQLNTVAPRFGGIVGYEFISEEKVGNFILRYTYVVKYQKHIIRWVFILYKPQNAWVINIVKFDDNIKALFE